MSDREKDTILKMIDYINKSINYTNGYTYEMFINNDLIELNNSLENIIENEK